MLFKQFMNWSSDVLDFFSVAIGNFFSWLGIIEQRIPENDKFEPMTSLSYSLVVKSRISTLFLSNRFFIEAAWETTPMLPTQEVLSTYTLSPSDSG